MRWTIAGLEESVFELGDAAPFAMYGGMAERLPHENIKNWVTRGFIRPKMGARGKKTVRLYTTSDLLRIFSAGSLVRQHTSLECAFICGSVLVRRLIEQIEAGSLVTDPTKEHWMVFTDNGAQSTEYTGDSKTNFHMNQAYTNENGSFPSLSGSIPGDYPWEVKQETFNADRLIAKFVYNFHRIGAHEIFKERALDSHYLGRSTDFEKSVVKFLNRGLPDKRRRTPKGKA